MFRRFFLCLLLPFILASCSDNHVAPVVNAWYRSHGSSNTYVVRSNDSIYSIAWAFGLDYRSLAEANHLSPPYRLHNGQHLVMTTKPAENAINPVLMRHKNLMTPPPQQNETAVPSTPVVESTQPAVESYQPEPAPEHISFNSHWNWPARGRLIERFSRNPKGEPGISIAGQLGEPVRAAANGRVVYSGDGVRGYGNLIIIKHNDSYLSAYGFNEKNLVVVGENVRAGSIIARMGQNDAGRTLLYFEIRRDGVPVNPMKYLHG